MLSALPQAVRRTMARHALCPPGSRVLVAVSGGADSVALALLLLELAPLDGFTVTGLAHFNHRLRPTAPRDEQFCRTFATRLDLPFTVEGADVRASAEAQRVSIEEAARRLRYDFLERTASAVGADRIAVGHTQDDQAETFLLKLIRGAGSLGLGGIYPRRGAVIRPMLDISRTSVERYLTDRGHAWVEDETNGDLDNPRNRIRHVVLPELDRAYGGPTRPAIARAANLVREDGEWLDSLSVSRFEALVHAVPGGWSMDAVRLAGEALPIRRRVLLQALRMAARGREVGAAHVEAVLAVAGGTSGAADVPGGRMELREGKLVLLIMEPEERSAREGRRGSRPGPSRPGVR